jgi:hypothetical protein
MLFLCTHKYEVASVKQLALGPQTGNASFVGTLLNSRCFNTPTCRHAELHGFLFKLLLLEALCYKAEGRGFDSR